LQESYERIGRVYPQYGKVMKEEEWWILCVKKSLKRGLMDLLFRRVMEEDD
jgi:hypothetical protein